MTAQHSRQGQSRKSTRQQGELVSIAQLTEVVYDSLELVRQSGVPVVTYDVTIELVIYAEPYTIFRLSRNGDHCRMVLETGDSRLRIKRWIFTLLWDLIIPQHYQTAMDSVC